MGVGLEGGESVGYGQVGLAVVVRKANFASFWDLFRSLRGWGWRWGWRKFGRCVCGVGWGGWGGVGGWGGGGGGGGGWGSPAYIAGLGDTQLLCIYYLMFVFPHVCLSFYLSVSPSVTNKDVTVLLKNNVMIMKITIIITILIIPDICCSSWKLPHIHWHRSLTWSNNRIGWYYWPFQLSPCVYRATTL